MPASLKFYQSKTPTSGSPLTEATNLSEVKYIVFTDQTGNSYSIDISNEQNNLQLGYQPTGGTEITHDVIDLYGSLSKVFSFPVSSSGGAKSIFQTELVKTDNVTALTGSSEFTNNVYTKTNADSTFLKKDAAEADVTSLLSKITTADQKPITVSELPTKIVESNVTTALNDTFLNKNSATEADVTGLLNKITTEGNKLIKASELPTELAKANNVTALTGSSEFTSKVYTKTNADSTFLKTDASNFDNNKQADFLTKLGATSGNQLIEKIAGTVPNTVKTALMSVIENHNEEGLVPSYDTLW